MKTSYKNTNEIFKIEKKIDNNENNENHDNTNIYNNTMKKIKIKSKILLLQKNTILNGVNFFHLLLDVEKTILKLVII